MMVGMMGRSVCVVVSFECMLSVMFVRWCCG